MDLLKIVILAASFPIWGPFAKALWEEFRLALREDGGLTGNTPTPRELARIRETIAYEENSQVHEPVAHLRGGPAGPPATGPPATGPAPVPQGGARVPGPQAGSSRRSFQRSGANPAASDAPAGRRSFR